ncbi:MAG: heparinase II/III family protein [Pirellulales bacterium]|nr:heparinase II/III family protein [Pirellulales bacterium]
MKSIILGSLVLFSCLTAFQAEAASTRRPEADRIAQWKEMLPATPRGVGRPITDREVWEGLKKDRNWKSVIRHAEQWQGKPFPELTDALYLEFSKNGNRSRCQSVIGQRHKRLGPLVVAECLENQGRFLPEIEKTIREILSEKTWVLPAHDRALTNFKGKEITIDLRSSAVAWELATAVYWLGDRLGAKVRDEVQEELERRVFGPFESMIRQGEPRMWWIQCTNNWNAVCLANVTGAALTAIESPSRRAFFAAAAEANIRNFLEGFTSDGYCSEGLGYWNYGFGNFLRLAETLHQQTGGRVDLMDSDQIRAISQFGRRMEMMPGVYPALADCKPGSRPGPWMMRYVDRRYGFGWTQDRGPLDGLSSVASLADFGLLAFPNSVTPRPEPIEPPATQPRRDWFPDAGVLIGRPAPGTDNALGVALKGGHNAEHHNHNDVGSFVVALAGKTPLVDPGSEVYTRRTFGSRRYKSGVLNSWGHPVPLVAGKRQHTGRDAQAKVLRTDFTDKNDTLVLDLRSAYEVDGLKKLERTFVFSRENRGSLTVTDRVEMATPERFGVALITFDKWRRTAPDRLVVGQGAGAIVVEIDAHGAAFDIHSEEIHEDLPDHRIPTRLGIDLEEPTATATVTLTIQPND